MVKMNKEYSDAFGFRLLGHFTAFLAEYPEKGGQIQSICDEDFKATCIKCYPIILSTGIDPAKYNPPVVAAAASIRSTLREMFPVKEEVIDLDVESEDDEEAPPSPELLKCPSNSPRRPKISLARVVEKPVDKKEYPKEPLLKSVDISCFQCSRLSTINNNLLKDLELSTQNEKKLTLENHNLRKALAEKTMDLKIAQQEYNKLSRETSNLREDPAYPDILNYFEYLKTKRKRTQ